MLWTRERYALKLRGVRYVSALASSSRDCGLMLDVFLCCSGVNETSATTAAVVAETMTITLAPVYSHMVRSLA